jgi:hypothetical protein
MLLVVADIQRRPRHDRRIPEDKSNMMAPGYKPQKTTDITESNRERRILYCNGDAGLINKVERTMKGSDSKVKVCCPWGPGAEGA